MAADRVRKNVNNLEGEELNLLRKAFQGIMALPHSDPNSYFHLASLHGIGADACTHHQQEFLPWHRKYVRLFEDALRSIPGCETVTLPFWDATGVSVEIPNWLTEPPFAGYNVKTAFTDGEWPNVVSEVASIYGQSFFQSPVTVRRAGFPQSTLDALNQFQVSVRAKSAMATARWDQVANHNSTTKGIEVPHDYIHVAVGGWMSHPATAAFDPIFWFHHSNVERLFKIWQHQRNATTRESLETLRGAYQIPWDREFQKQGDTPLSQSTSHLSFSGTISQQVWEADIAYSPGSFSPPNLRLNMASFRAFHHTPEEEIVSPSTELILTPLLSIRIKNIDRSTISGTFIVRLFANDTIVADMVGFQKGSGCSGCRMNNLFAVDAIIPATEMKPDSKLSFKIFPFLIDRGVDEDNPIKEFGNPVVNIRLLVEGHSVDAP